MNAVGALILAGLIPLVLVAPARWAVLSIVAGALFLTQGQQVSVAGLNLFAMRFIELAAVARLVARQELRHLTLNKIDKAVLVLYVYTAIVFLLRSPDGHAFAIGVAVDAFICYFAFRALVTTVDDLKWFLSAFLLLLVPYVGLVLIENVTTRNPFASMGGFVLGADGSFDIDSWSRNGRLRSYGSFRHPSLLGTLGGAFLPFYMALYLDKTKRLVSAIGIALCLAIVWASNSGGPASCVAISVFGWLLWFNRTRMFLLRRTLAAIVVLAAIFMKAPIWYLIARFSSLTGGDGYHRSYLLDVSFQHLNQWWLAGTTTQVTSQWIPYVNGATGGADLTNQFLVFGVSSGLGAVLLLIYLVIVVYRRLGQALVVVRERLGDTALEALYWGAGVVLTVHVVNWLGVSYFDQTYVIWFLHLAVIVNLCETALNNVAAAPQARVVETNRNRLIPRRKLHAAGAGASLPRPASSLVARRNIARTSPSRRS